jgi:hypothetical protein
MDTQTILDKCKCSKTDKEWYYHSYDCPVWVISLRLAGVDDEE